MLSEPAARTAAELLLKARGDHRRLDRLPPECTPESVDDGMAIQNALAALWGLEVAGWKVGAASAAAMQMLRTDAPFPGRVFAPYLLDSPASVAASALHKCAVECEFAFRLGRGLPPRDADYGKDDIRDAVASAYPAIELVNDYWVDGLALGVAHFVADNGSNGALVLGAPIERLARTRPCRRGGDAHDRRRAGRQRNRRERTRPSAEHAGLAGQRPLPARHRAGRGRGRHHRLDDRYDALRGPARRRSEISGRWARSG